MESLTFRKMNQYVVKDEQAPAYYSQRAIWYFAIFFGVLFGSVLMAINLHKAGAKRGPITMVLGFGVVYTILQIWFSNIVDLGTPVTFGLNAIGSSVLQYFFWPKYIGAETRYRAKPIWMPLIIGIIIMIPFALAIFLE